MDYKGVFFDFDYTLGDCTVSILKGYQEGFRAMGLPAPTLEQVRPTVGMTLMDGYKRLTGDPDPEKGLEFYHRFQEAVGEVAEETGNRTMIEDSRLFPGTAELLTALKARGAAVAVVSTKLGITIRRIFEYHRLENVLDLIVGGKEVERHKPDPEGLFKALDALGLNREEVLFCGDTVIDAQTAKNAGVDFCAVLNGATPRDAFGAYPSVHIAEDLPDLQQWLNI